MLKLQIYYASHKPMKCRPSSYLDPFSLAGENGKVEYFEDFPIRLVHKFEGESNISLFKCRWNSKEFNRPFPSSPGPLYQNEVRCSTFLVKMSLVCMRMKNHFHIKDWAPNLVLIQRPGGNSVMAYSWGPHQSLEGKREICRVMLLLHKTSLEGILSRSRVVTAKKRT